MTLCPQLTGARLDRRAFCDADGTCRGKGYGHL